MAEMLEVVAGRSKVMLRVQFSEADRAAAAMDLPTERLTAAGSDPQVLWLAPDQWLITSDSDSADTMIRRCRAHLRGIVHSATDASAAFTTFRLEHSRASMLLAMGSGLDFDKLSYGQCARTRLARVPAVIVPLSPGAYDLYADSSYARYLQHWMALAVRDPLACMPTID